MHHVVGLAKFATQKIKYAETKTHLKNALLEAKDPGLKSTIAHNLAVINLCEVQDHNERVASQGGEVGHYINSKEADEAISQQN